MQQTYIHSYWLVIIGAVSVSDAWVEVHRILIALVTSKKSYMVAVVPTFTTEDLFRVCW
jgi:hypothetical protein